jgi:GT2 family glycosyltransferase
LFESVGGFNERLRYNEDSDLCNRIHKKGYRIIYSPQAKVNHFMGLDSFCEFARFIYKYGLERGKNIAQDKKLFTKFNAVSTAFLLLSISLIGVSFFSVIGVIMLVSLISFVILILIFSSLRIAINKKSPILAFLGPPIYASIFIFYNVGLLSGYVSRYKGNNKNSMALSD